VMRWRKLLGSRLSCRGDRAGGVAARTATPIDSFPAPRPDIPRRDNWHFPRVRKLAHSGQFQKQRFRLRRRAATANSAERAVAPTAFFGIALPLASSGEQDRSNALPVN
jgi:hypothetical protein